MLPIPQIPNNFPRVGAGQSSPTLLSLICLLLDPSFFSHDKALAAGGRLIRILRLFDLCDEELKGLVDVLVVAGAGLGPATVVSVGELLAVVGRDLALLGAQIALVAHDDDGDPLDTLWRSTEGLMSVPSERWKGRVESKESRASEDEIVQRTRWFSSFSRMTWTISKEDLEATE